MLQNFKNQQQLKTILFRSSGPSTKKCNLSLARHTRLTSATNHKNNTQETFKAGWKPIFKIIQNKAWPMIQGSNNWNNSKLWGGDQNLRNLGRTVAMATIGNYLVNLDLWEIILWVANCLTTNASIEFFQLSRFLKWRKCVPLIIDDSPIWESGNQIFKSR